MKVLALAALFAAVLTTFVDASPTPAPGAIPELLARSSAKKQTEKDCSSSEFFYSSRSCCLTKGGPKTTPKTPSGVQCPSSWYYHSGQGCCVPRTKPTTTKTPTCSTKGWSWSSGRQCCEKGSGGSGTSTGSGSKPSAKPKPRQKVKAKAKAKAKHRRDEAEELALAACPADMGLTTCPSVSNGVLDGGFECVDTQNDVNSCGGCASDGTGAVCTVGQQCVEGACTD